MGKAAVFVVLSSSYKTAPLPDTFRLIMSVHTIRNLTAAVAT